MYIYNILFLQKKIVKYIKELLCSESDSLVSKQTVFVILKNKNGANMGKKKTLNERVEEMMAKNPGIKDFDDFYSRTGGRK